MFVVGRHMENKKQTGGNFGLTAVEAGQRLKGNKDIGDVKRIFLLLRKACSAGSSYF